MLRNFIWDFDGTLVNTYPHITAAACAVLTAHKTPHDPDEVFAAFGVSFGYAFKQYGMDKEQIEEFRALYADPDFPPDSIPFAGAGETLRAIVSAGGKNFLNSHSERDRLEFYLRRFGWSELFTGIVSIDDALPLKPAPDSVLKLLRTYGLDPAETVMIGDRALDAQSGISAGTQGILITNGVFRPDCDIPRCEDFASLRRLLGL